MPVEEEEEATAAAAQLKDPENIFNPIIEENFPNEEGDAYKNTWSISSNKEIAPKNKVTSRHNNQNIKHREQ